jgi:hypothetical protein
MHLTGEEIVNIVTSLLTILTFLLTHVFHAQKLSDKIEQVGQKVVQDAPQIAQAVNEASGVVQDLSK